MKGRLPIRGAGPLPASGAILGARGCAFKDLEPWTIYAGNPAKKIKERVRGEAAETPAA